MTKVLIVDDHPVVLEGIKGAMSEYSDFEVVGEASDGREAIKKVESLRPDIVVMDIAMSRFNGVEATRQIKREYPHVKVIIFTLHSYREFIHPLIKAGISGCRHFRLRSQAKSHLRVVYGYPDGETWRSVFQ
jgi:DNA-binding NarL/FixJ family response regulator